MKKLFLSISVLLLLVVGGCQSKPDDVYNKLKEEDFVFNIGGKKSVESNTMRITKERDRPDILVSYAYGDEVKVTYIKYSNGDATDLTAEAIVYSAYEADYNSSRKEIETRNHYLKYLKKLGISEDEFIAFLCWYKEKYNFVF